MSSPLLNRTEPIPGYKLLERLGSGGFGEVWKCEAPGGIQKAIKFVYGDLEASGDEGALAEREHKALERVKQVRHPFILSLERYDIIDGRLIILTELADCNLWDRFRVCRNQGLPGIPRGELLRYMREAAEALDMMNDEYQIQHLDIKPQNLFLVHKHIKVADFGMAKVFEGLRATITGGVTPVYAAPETFEGWISRHCDQYSLAIVYQELLTGVRPFNGSNTKQLLLQHLTAPPDLTPLPEPERPIVGRALAKKPDERHPSCLALVEALERTQAATALLPPAPTASPTLTPGRVLPPMPRDPMVTQAAGGAPLTLSPPPASGLNSQLAPARDEQNGTGVLQPTLVIGLGWLGGRIVRRLSGAIIERFGDLDHVPTLRVLAFDTDAEAIKALTLGDARPLSHRFAVGLPLQRPSQYARRDSAPPIENWLDSAMLYRMPRIPATNGVRAYGRLALLDHARQVVQRLQSELEAVIAPAARDAAERHTGLGLRSSRPRVFIVTSLAGGAGSGMMPDLAYLARATLRRLGCEQTEVIGLMLVPHADAKRSELANACGTLTEIIHLSRPDTTFELRIGSREPPIADPGPPFTRLLAVPLEKGRESTSSRRAVGQAAGLLLDELFSQLGPAVATARATDSRNVDDGSLANGRDSTGSGAAFCQVAATYRFIWPRRRLIRRTALRLTESLVRRWTAKDASPIRSEVVTWFEEQWTSRRLQPELMIERLQEACAAAIGEPPDARFDSLVATLAERTAHGSRLDAYSACAVLDDVIALVGKPPTKGPSEPAPGRLQQTIGALTADLAAEYNRALADMAVHFIDRPGTRLAAAEETIHQLVARLQELARTYEVLYSSLERESAELYRRLIGAVGALDAGSLGTRKSTVVNDVLELLRAYPKKRFQAMLAGFTLSTYRSLLGTAPDCLRDVNVCRDRLAEVLSLAEKSAAEAPGPGSSLGPGRDPFPGGHANLDAAARALVADLGPDDLLAFDDRVQKHIRREFDSLVRCCLEASGLKDALLGFIERQAQTYLAERLGTSRAAEVFFDHFGGDEHAAQQAIAEAAAEAMPESFGTAAANGGLVALAVPDGAAGDRIIALAEDAVPDNELIRAASVDDIVIYREISQVPLTALPPFAPAARQAYQQHLGSEAPPHARNDVKWQLPAN